MPEKPLSQITTVGPVWRTDTWLCTSTAEFMVHGVLIAYTDKAGLEIFLSGIGTQPDFELERREMKTFSIGGSADSSLRITRTSGVITGFITMQTTPDAIASCEQI